MDAGSTWPSTTTPNLNVAAGPVADPAAVTGALRSFHDKARRSAIECAPLAYGELDAELLLFRQRARAGASGDARTAFRNRAMEESLASGDAVEAVIDAATCPPTVTFAGSPPNAAMLSWTQRSAAIRSSNA